MIFKGISISEEGQIPERFIDGGMKCNNPVKEAMDEARSVFGDDRPLGVLLSIGAGHPGTIGLSELGAFQNLLPTNLMTVLKNIATDCESTAEEVKRQWKNIPDRYFRFSVTHGTEAISPEERKKMKEFQTHTKSYLQGSEVSDAIESLVRRVCGMAPAGSTLTLGKACESYFLIIYSIFFGSKQLTLSRSNEGNSAR
jgi:hypothetical protein